MWEDPIVAEVRRVREELSAKFDYDVKAIFADMRERQDKSDQRLVLRRKQAGVADAVEPGPIPAPDPGTAATVPRD